MGGRRRRPAQRWLTEPRPETPQQRERRLSRRAWRWVWAWPLPAAIVLLAGGMATEPFPAGTTKETVLLGTLVALTVPGAVARLREAVRRARRPAAERLAEQRAEQKARGRDVDPRVEEAMGPPGLLEELGTWALGWGFAQALLALALTLLITALPVAEGWSTAPAPVVILGLLPPMLLILGWIAFGGLAALRAAFSRADLDDIPGPSAPATLVRATALSLGACLLGLATFGIPYAVVSAGDGVDLPRRSLFALARYAASDLDAAPGWVLALRVTCVMVYGGLAGVAVTSPLLLLRAIRGRNTPDARSEAGEAGPAPATTDPATTDDTPNDPPNEAPDTLTSRPPGPRPALRVPAPRPMSPASLRRLRRHARRQVVVTAEARALAVLRAGQIVGITAAGAALALGVAVWVAAVTERESVTWTLVTGGRVASRVDAVMVSRDDLVLFALGLSAPQVLLAAVGWIVTRRRSSGAAAHSDPGPSDLSLAALVLTVMLVPGLVGCYLISHWVGPDSTFTLLPGAWAQLGFFGTMIGGGIWLSQRRGRGSR